MQAMRLSQAVSACLLIFVFLTTKTYAQESVVVGAEYFFNSDPGFGNGISVAVTQGQMVNFSSKVPTSGLPDGMNRLSIRVKDQNDVWSLTQTRIFWISRVVPNPISQVVAAEYFFNSDPGFGNGMPLGVTAGLNPQLEGVIDVAGLTRGLHRFSVRFRNQDNEWGLLTTKLFFVENAGFNDLVVVDYIEYFFDNDDPGWGQAIEIPLELAASAIDLNEFIAVAELDAGIHSITIRIRNNNGFWSTAETREFTVNEPNPDDPPVPDVETLPDMTSMCVFGFESMMIPTAKASDGSTIIGTTDETIFPITQQGTTVIVWTFTDANGLESTQEQQIILADITPPVIEEIENVLVETAAGVCSLAFDILPPTASDNCSVLSVSGIRSDELPLDAPYPVGTTSIIWEASDLSGNVSLPFVQEIQVVESLEGPTSPGSLDLSFLSCPNEGVDGLVRTSVIQPDGKIIIGGDFTSVNGIARNRIARLNADGTLDNTFDPGLGADFEIWSAVLQPDGRILIGGRFFMYNGIDIRGVARLNSDGSLDTFFNPGTGTNNGGVLTLVLQQDGRIIIGGLFTSVNGMPRNYIARLNPDGSLDASFNTGTGANETVRTIAVQEDGKIIIGGLLTSYNERFLGGRGIARLNEDGSLDPSFKPVLGTGGIVASSVIQPDGKIIIMGEIYLSNLDARYGIARLNPDGIVDSSFSLLLEESGPVNFSVLQDDGKIIIGGDFGFHQNTTVSNIARLNANGNLDNSFTPRTGTIGPISTISIQPDGNIVIGGGFTSYDGFTRNRVARIFGGGTTTAKLPPTPDEKNLPDVTSECMVDFSTLKPPTATAFDGSTIIGTTDENIFPITQQGTTEIVWTFTDINGLITNQEQQILIRDITPPVISTPQEITVPADPGQCFATDVNLGTPEAKDECGIVSLTNDAPEEFPLGTTVVTWTARDVGGNETTRSFNVTVEDREAPSISGPADLNLTIQAGSSGASNVSLGNPTVTDNCDTPSISNNAPEIFPTGLTVVLWTAEDAAGNQSTAEQRITVTAEQLPTLPTIQAPAPIQISADPGRCDATGIDLGMPQVSGDLAADAISNDAPALFPIGTTVITWTLRDRAGNTVSDRQEVVVLDTEKPIIARAGRVPILADPFSCFLASRTLSPPQVTDNCGTLVPVATRADGLSLTDPYPLGENRIIWTAVDAAGNEADPVTEVLFVEYSSGIDFDEISREFTLSINPGQCSAVFEFELPEVNHLCESLVPIGTRSDGRPLADPYPIGWTGISWVATDSQGKRAMSSWNIAVHDNEIPQIIPSENISLETPMGVCSTGIQVTPPQATDNCRISQISGTRSDGLALADPYPVGLTSVTWIAVDASGNESVPYVQEIEVVEDYGIEASPGRLDLSFATEHLRFGSENYQFWGREVVPRNYQIYAMVVQPDGKVLVGGDFVIANERRSWRRLARFNPDGTLDESFDIGTGTDGVVRSIALQPDGRIIVGGKFTFFNGQRITSLLRLEPTGILDRRFNLENDLAVFSFGGSGRGEVRSIILLENGKIMIAGDFITNGTINGKLALLNSDGTSDVSFKMDGILGVVNTMTQDQRGNIYIGGGFQYQGLRNLMRIQQDETVDQEFSRVVFSQGIQDIQSYAVTNISILPNDKILIGGTRTVRGSAWLTRVTSNYVLKFHSESGNLDPSFDPGLLEGGSVYTAIDQNDGKIIIGGDFESINGIPIRGIARLNPNGSLDEGFVPPSSTKIRSLAFQSDGKILAGGLHFSQDGISRRGIVRLYSDPCIPETCTVEINPQDVALRLNASGRATLRVKDVISASSTHCQIGELQYHFSKSVFTCSDIGENRVTLRIVAEDGSESEMEFNVLVTDDMPPVIDEMRPLAALKQPNKSYKLPDFTSIYNATDNCGVMSYIQQPEPGTLIEKPGNYQLTFAATDVNGNKTSVKVTLYLREREEDWLKSFESIRDRGVIIVPWGTQFSTFSETRLTSSKADEADKEIQVNWNPEGYNPLVPGLYTLSGKVNTKSIYQGEKEVELQVLVNQKPLPEDILISNDRLSHRIKAGEIIGSLSTLDPVDEIHSYALDEHPEVYLEGGLLVWKGGGIPPAQTKVTVHSTDRVGQTISRELTLYRDTDKPLDLIVYPNPALQETNLLIQIPKAAVVFIRVFDSAGRLIYEENTPQEGSFSRLLNLRGFSQGMYQILVQVDNQLLTRKFLKK